MRVAILGILLLAGCVTGPAETAAPTPDLVARQFGDVVFSNEIGPEDTGLMRWPAGQAVETVLGGDVARWRHPHYEEPVRFEHWTNAVEQGVHAAKRLLHGPGVGAFAPIPLFWTDQFGVKMQVAGTVGATDEVCVVEGDPAEYRFAALVRRGSKLGGVITFRRARLFIRYSEMIADGLGWDEALGAARA